MKAIHVNELKSFSVKALTCSGMPAENAGIVADVLVTTDLFGVHSHGTKNLYDYVRKMKAGGLDAGAEPAVVSEGPAWAVMDGNAAIGMVTGCKAMRLAMEKARACGVGYVGVRNSCHFGAAGYYANMAAESGLFGLAMSNGDPVMAAPGGRGVAIGNNPFSFAVPYEGGRTVFLDIALSSAAALKVVMAKERGDRVPMDWLVDENGKPTDDPGGFPGKASLQPMGGHKGYGLAVMVEVLAAVLTGAGMLSQVPSWNLKMGEKNNVGHAFIAMDIGSMMPGAEFAARMGFLGESLHQAPKADGSGRIYLPGEIEWEKREKALRENRLFLTDAMYGTLSRLSETTGVALPVFEA